MKDYENITGGLNITSQIPLDVKEYCINEYGIDLKTIHNLEKRNENLAHLKRIKKFQEDWDNLFK